MLKDLRKAWKLAGRNTNNKRFPHSKLVRSLPRLGLRSRDMYGNNFDGNAAFSGGGFMPSQATQSADLSSPAKSRDTQPLLPLTVKQISKAVQGSDEKSNFLIDGVDANNVTLVGMVFNKSERVTDVSFVIDDGTGRIDCNRWVNEVVDTKEMENIRDCMYVRVHGHLKGFQGKKQLVVFSIRPVTDYNEIANHFIECIYAHFDNTRKLQGGAPTSAHITNSAGSTPLKGYQAAPSNEFSAQFSMDGLKGIENIILDFLQQPSSLSQDKGIHRNELAQRLNVSSEKIVESLEALESEGLVYSTIDEFHYRSTASG